MFGGETLYQLRSALQLAEIEREGVSTVQTQSCGVVRGTLYVSFLKEIEGKFLYIYKKVRLGVENIIFECEVEGKSSSNKVECCHGWHMGCYEERL